MNTKMTKLALAMGAMTMAGGAMALSATDNLTVSANIASTCSITAGALSFGSYVGTTAVSGSSNTSVLCTSQTAWTVGLTAVTTFSMTSSTNALAYELFTDSTAGTVVLASVGGVITGAGTGVSQAATIYGRISAGQYKPAGSYAQSINLTVTY